MTVKILSLDDEGVVRKYFDVDESEISKYEGNRGFIVNPSVVIENNLNHWKVVNGNFMARVGVLDDNKRLVAYKEIEHGTALSSNEITVNQKIDLPVNGTFKWNGTSFMPLGFDFGKPTRSPVDESFVLYSVVKTMKASGVTFPNPVNIWQAWYEIQLAQRLEELATRRNVSGDVVELKG